MTDVVDSTQLSQALGDARMATLWAAHDKAARDLLKRWGGREIEKTDGLLALFDRAADAARFALDYHRALGGLDPPLTARAAVHVGPVTVRETGAEYIEVGAKRLEIDGLAKPVVARVMALAVGRQTLLTQEALGSVAATELIVRSHGHWRLKGITEPVELYEVGDDRSPFTPPADEAKAHRVIRQRDLWLPVRDVRHNLPAERDSFVGREEPLRELSQVLDAGARLVSVLGPAGTGKTRFVLHFAWSFLGDYPGGTWFCDLSQAKTVDGIHFAVAQALEVPLQKAEPATQLAHVIASRGRCLVIFDNFEQVVAHAERTVGHWLERAPEATFLSTSREVLGIVGEDVFGLSTLPEREASLLFCKRAQAVQRKFSPTADEQTAISQLGKVLDGLPLAIELAAARVPVMSPRMLLARMNERFSLLASRSGRTDRQATLRAALDWSWDLLSVDEKRALAELSVFEGGFTLESAAAVLSGAQDDKTFFAVDMVACLVGKSLVQSTGDARFDMLRSIQEYAELQLRTQGQYPGSGPAAHDGTQIRHARYFAMRANDASEQRTSVDVGNFVAAAQRAIARGDASTVVATIEGAWRSLRLSGPFNVAIQLAEAASALRNLSSRQRAEIDFIAGRALLLAGCLSEARRRLEATRNFAGVAGPPLRFAQSLGSLAEVSYQEGRLEEARDLYGAGLEIARSLSEQASICEFLGGWANCQELLGAIQDAQRAYEEVLQIAEFANQPRRIGGAMGNLGQFFANQGSADRALPLYVEAIRIAHSLGDRQWEGNMLCNLGLLQHERGDSASAEKHLLASLGLARDIGHTRLESVVLCNLGLANQALGDIEAARKYFEAALSIARDRKDRRSCGQFLGYSGVLHARCGRSAQAWKALAEGESFLREVGDRLSLGVLLCAKAETAWLSGNVDAATQAFNEAESYGAALCTALTSELGIALDQTRHLLPNSPPNRANPVFTG